MERESIKKKKGGREERGRGGREWKERREEKDTVYTEPR